VVVEGIARVNLAGATNAAASTSPTGTIAYRSGDTGVTVRTNLKWVDRLGNVIERINGPPGIVINAALAPNGRRFTWFNGTVWLYDLATRTASKFTFSSGVDFGAIWSPDGARIVFGSNRNGVFDLYQKDATGAGSEELLLATSELKVPTDWSQDGKFVLFRSLNPKTTFDIWGVSIADRKAFPIAATPFDERDGQFSPDGKWIAYQSNESGRFEIWVRPFRQPGSSVKADERWQFTNDGGTQVRWSHDGKEIFYVSADGRLMSLPVSIESGGRAPLHAAAVPLFSIGAQPYSGGTALPWYMVSADSKRFLTVSDPPPLTTTPVTVLLNWHPQP
jgi:Tol biopolymer transport system component